MKNHLLSSCLFLLVFASVLYLLPQHAFAHKGGIIVQAIGDQLVTGWDDEGGGGQTIGDRTFALLFPSSLANDVPSFLSFTQAPADTEPLPVGGSLYWDFLPMTVDGVTSNLLYWDGLGSAAEFAPTVPGAITLSIWTQNFADSATIDGAAQMVPGKQIGMIQNNNLALHAHRWFFLDSPTAVPQGVYLFALQLRMDGYLGTNPFYIVAATNETSLSALDDIAMPWTRAHVDALVRRGDFNFDGAVDGADYFVWRDQVGATGPFPIDGAYADGDRNGVVNGADLDVWQEYLTWTPRSGDFNGDGVVDLADFNVLKSNFGGDESALVPGSHNADGQVDLADFNILKANFGTGVAPVPEPGAWCLALLAIPAMLVAHRRTVSR